MVLLCLQILLLLFLVKLASLQDQEDKQVFNYNPDTHLSTPQLIVKYGYPVETHTVLTEDGYFLTLHRIPHGRNKTSGSRPTVFVQHGILCSSADWVILGPNKSLGYILADNGYDVWLGNARGNTYSKGHIKYATENSNFWKFSFHEMGVFDLPAVVNYILKTTGLERLTYIGHSMGTTMFYVLLSERPEYNSKIKVMISLSPVAYLSHMTSSLNNYLATSGPEPFFRMLNTYRFFNFLPNFGLGKRFCRNKAFSRTVCENIMFSIGGYGTTQLNSSMVPVILGHAPAGTSIMVLKHYIQINKYDMFCKFDFGVKENKVIYHTMKPPPYNLTNVNVPVSLHYSDHDALASKADVMILHDQLPNLIGIYRVPLKEFNHLDFIWGKDAKSLVYDTVLDILKKYS